MAASIITRYGHSENIASPDSDWITHRLLNELKTEQFDEPDNEHTQVSVSNEHWSVSVQVSGLVYFDNLDLLEGEESDLPETMYLRDIDDTELVSIWRAVVSGDQDALLDHGWVCEIDELPPYRADYYR
ncbi:MAG: hypothetical protein AAGA29_13665 [Planctomycetota bacterium]